MIGQGQENLKLDSKVLIQAIEANPGSNIQSISGLQFHSSVGFVTFTTMAKVSRTTKWHHMLTKYGKTFDSPK